MRNNMTEQQINTVKQSWRLLRDIDPQLLGDVFYRRLFLKYPSVKPLFKGPMDVQNQKLVDMLSFIVAFIDQPDTFAPEVVSMANRHKEYGTKPAHYLAVGEVLLWTLEKGLGKQWNDEVKEAWTACYTTLTQAMLEKV